MLVHRHGRATVCNTGDLSDHETRNLLLSEGSLFRKTDRAQHEAEIQGPFKESGLLAMNSEKKENDL
jgi:hypothetical protein